MWDFWRMIVVLSDVMVSVLAFGQKVHGFKPGRGSGFLRAIKICSTLSFRGGVKLLAPCCEIFQHVKIHYKV
jgi:hypothetical protein